ncbi:methyltransferase domain-containing protein [Psychromonas sp. psych-6C06]|uniref:methyltransferase domain-containing protein n=1 Tax=Psychromonas sp. psych-6C06 TaxID=2058089 RepID=UPI0019311164|nr:methyltransferase domain-containing protein [Psychromonas sp. psych-6C06]
MSDHNFDSIAQKFIDNIYGSNKGKIREVVVWNELLKCLALLPDKKLRILDAGGGFGFFSQRLAKLGHQVVICDISQILLDEAKAQLADKDYQKNVTLLHCPIQDLPNYIEGQFDLILNHAVLEWLVAPKQTLQGLFSFLAPQGLFSLMFYNIDGQRFQNLVSGNFEFVANGMKRKKVVRLTPTNPISEKDVRIWLGESNMQIIEKTGVRILHDYLKESSHCQDKFEQLLSMEQKFNQQEPYASLGRYTHLTIQAQ